MTSGTQDHLGPVTFPCSTSLGLWRDSEEIQVLVQAEAADVMAVNLGSCSSSGWAAESCRHHGMSCLSHPSPSLGCPGLQTLRAIKAGGELHSWNRLSPCLVVLGNQALQKAVLHFLRCLEVSAVTELLKAH